jgi:cytochrome P450
MTVVILPTSSISELKDVPTSKASFRKFLYEYWQGRYSYIGQYSHALEGAIKTGISQNVNFQLSTLTDETKFAMDQNIGVRKDWSEVPLSSVFHKIVALTTFRTFVGLPLSRDETWIEATTQYASTLEKFASAVRGWPVSVQWLVAPIYWFTSVRKHQQVFINMLDPIVRAAKQARRDHLNGVSGKSPGTLIEWMLSYYRGREAKASEITGAQLTASFAAIHSTVGLLEHVLLDLASRPDYLQGLREELAEHCPSGQIDKIALGKLWKMDSFIKESQRYNPATACK